LFSEKLQKLIGIVEEDFPKEVFLEEELPIW
jgi:hypothetical protein